MGLEKSNKSNKQFMLMSALGILFVVDAHAWSPLGIMTNFFPYNSFFMPMFCFISGYFFKNTCLINPVKYLIHKVKTLLVPLFVWNFIYGSVVSLLRNAGVISYGKPLSWYTLFIEPFLDGEVTELMNPAWFVPALFMVIMVYVLVRKILVHIWNEIVASITMIILGAFCVYLSRHGYNERMILLPILKTGFLIQFYQIGILYHNVLEKYFRKVSKRLVFISTVSMNAVLIYLYPEGIWFNNISSMSGFLTDNYFLLLLTSITGISFWLKVSEMLEPIFRENRFVNYVSENTFTIMLHHLTFFNLYNLILLWIPRVPQTFDEIAFRSTAWYRFEPVPAMRVIYVWFGLLGPLVVKAGYQFIRNRKQLLLEQKTAL